MSEGPLIEQAVMLAERAIDALDALVGISPATAPDSRAADPARRYGCCHYCGEQVWASDGQIRHTPACPWLVARRFLDGLEAKEAGQEGAR